MTKTEKCMIVLAASLLLAAAVYFALPAPQTVFSQAPPPAAATAAPEERLDLNMATAEQLDDLPGIGPTLAGRIVDYRAEHGPFSAPEELMAVDGIGEGRYAAVEGLIICQKEAP